MMKKLTEQELIENVEKFYGLIEKYLPNNTLATTT
jgi:hypothetical protein